jgi:hypothetical protein
MDGENNMNFNKKLIYISPSAFMEWERCSYKHWLKKLSGHQVENSQGLAAAAGNAFDTCVKYKLAKELGIDHYPKLHLINLAASINVENDDLFREVMQVGENLAKRYFQYGFAKRVISEGLYDLELNIFRQLSSFNILGLPDGCLKQEDDELGTVYVPLDFKVRGYKSKLGYSPTPGYKMYISTSGETKGIHTKHGTPLEELNRNWAVQMCVYYWLLNNDTTCTHNIPVAIDEVCHGRKHITFSQIRTHITPKFQLEVWQGFCKMWNQCNRPERKTPGSKPGLYDPVHLARISKDTCYAYNQLCEASAVCKPYERGMTDDELFILG